MIRPDALIQILRWRELAIGVAAAGLGLWLAIANYGITRWIGVLLVLGGIAIAREGATRLMRPRDGEGAGVVDVTERQITYLSATGGGAVSLDTLSRVTLDRSGAAAPVWDISDTLGNRVQVPSDAANANAILDALAADSRIDSARVLSALRDSGRGTVVLLDAAPKRLG